MPSLVLKVEVLRDWGAATALQSEWQSLQRQADTPSPFSSFEWFDAWYQAYCQPENVRVIVVRDEHRVRAILPGVRDQRRYGGLSLSCFAFAGEWGIPRCGVIALPGDMDAVRLALMTAIVADASTHLVTIPNIEFNSLTWQALAAGMPAPGSPQIESTYESPVYSMPAGWEAYLASRSREFRRRVRQSTERCQARGELCSRVFSSGCNFDEGLERLRTLEPRTWQGSIRNGVFRHEKDERFYKQLSSVESSVLRLEIEFLQIDGVDVAFMLMAILGQDLFLLRTGYDTSYENCRPGVVLRERIGKRLAAEGIIHFDLGAGVYEVKRRWETHRRTYGCFWLVNRSTLKGRLLLLELWLWPLLKPLLRRQRKAVPEAIKGAAGDATGMVSV